MIHGDNDKLKIHSLDERNHTVIVSNPDESALLLTLVKSGKKIEVKHVDNSKTLFWNINLSDSVITLRNRAGRGRKIVDRIKIK